MPLPASYFYGTLRPGLQAGLPAAWVFAILLPALRRGLALQAALRGMRGGR